VKTGFARTAAAEWVMKYASGETGFKGAYFSGSTILLPDDAPLPPFSDIDVVIVTEQDPLPAKLGKFVYRNTLMEVTYFPWSQYRSAEEILSSYHLANSFRTDTVIADPTGHLRDLQTRVARHFAEPAWVRRRCENALEKIGNGIGAIDPSTPLHDRVTAWLFPTGVTAHVILVAALRNPTVRLRYLAAREALLEYGHAGFYEDLLALLGCARLSPQRVAQHLDALAQTFDAAVAVAKTPFVFSTDITAAARPIAIDGSRELIRSGFHRETVFWIVATFARCHKILAADAPPDLQRALAPAFEAVIADLGIAPDGALIRRAGEVTRFLPRLRKTAEAILEANPGLTNR